MASTCVWSTSRSERISSLFNAQSKGVLCMLRSRRASFATCLRNLIFSIGTVTLYIQVCYRQSTSDPSLSPDKIHFYTTRADSGTTDIKAQNILFEFGEPGEIEEYLKEDAEKPLPHKVAIDRFLYLSRPFGIPKLLGRPVLADFGHASLGDEENMRPIQPDAYRAPEVIMEATWSYSADIWNMGCFVST